MTIVRRPAEQAADRWEATYDPGVPRHLTYPAIPLHALLERTARESGLGSRAIVGIEVAEEP